MKVTSSLSILAAVFALGCSSSDTRTASSGSSGTTSSGSSGTSGAADGGGTSATTLFRTWNDTGEGPWKCSDSWRAMDLSSGHYGDDNAVILEDYTSDRCIMVGNIVKGEVVSGVEKGTLTLTEKEMCPGLGSIGLKWEYSYSLDSATRRLTLSTNVCATTGRAGGGTIVFR